MYDLYYFSGWEGNVLFFVIRTVASFAVVLIWLNHTLPAVLPHLKAVLERGFWNGLQLARRITLNRLDVVKPLSLERHIQFWEHRKVAGSHVGTVQRLAKLYNLVFRQKLLHKVRWMRWRVIVVKKPVIAWPETRSFSSYGIMQTFQKFNVIFFVHHLTFWSKFVVHNTLTIEKNNQHWLDMAPSLTYYLTACTTTLCVLCPYFRPQRPSVLFQSSPKKSCRVWSKTWCKSVDLFFVSFSTLNKCDEQKKHVDIPLTHAARDPRRPASNYGIRGVREGLLVTLIPRRGQSSALARRYKRRSNTFRILLITPIVGERSYFCWSARTLQVCESARVWQQCQWPYCLTIASMHELAARSHTGYI